MARITNAERLSRRTSNTTQTEPTVPALIALESDCCGDGSCDTNTDEANAE